jgi:hypothetical protein
MRLDRGGARFAALLALMWVWVGASACFAGEVPKAEANAGFDTDARALETRLEQQHRSHETFLVPADSARLRKGELIIEHLTKAPGKELPGALEHDWRGTAFVAGAKASDFERVIQDVDAYTKVFAPEVLKARVLAPPVDGHATTQMRVRQKHVITVVMDSTYDVSFGRLDAQDGYSSSRSTKLAEIAGAGTANEHALGPEEDHGFLWRLNSYWSYQERDGGLYMQIESMSLTRSIPAGFGWIVGPFVESVPKESLEFTLRAVCAALKNRD